MRQKGKINPVHLVDVPGHSRLRPKLEEFLPQAAAIVFVVDALETDKLTAHTKEFIRKQMEKEIEKLRASRSAVSTAVIANDFSIGIEGEVFSFSHCYNKVTVAEASGLTGETVQIQDFIREYIKP
ncbi:Small GTPase superfamily ARF/SAR type [Arabidopsis suecica]|uniref:Small GTPase superfamily ARF/SAR type n=1 Tax=Arabidopsis suecica TaxID=45249 RepID=A0A8T1XQH3_ARASU|nr:Small GTPase superfamily ARF/SAR type [Arabidopsis suecica]